MPRGPFRVNKEEQRHLTACEVAANKFPPPYAPSRLMIASEPGGTSRLSVTRSSGRVGGGVVPLGGPGNGRSAGICGRFGFLPELHRYLGLGRLYRADAVVGHNGRDQLWRCGNPGVVGGTVYLGVCGPSTNGVLCAFDAATGQTAVGGPALSSAHGISTGAWEVPGCWCDAGPTVANGVIYYSSNTGSVLTAAQATTGTTLWTSNAEDQPATTSYTVAGGSSSTAAGTTSPMTYRARGQHYLKHLGHGRFPSWAPSWRSGPPAS